MFVIKEKDGYVKWINGKIVNVSKPEQATKFHSEKIAKVTVEELKQKNYRNVCYEKI